LQDWDTSRIIAFLEIFYYFWEPSHIPIPSIFVYQRDDGVWDVIDGVQRLSTIFQFIGILEKENGERFTPLQLETSDYLPSLKGKMWKNEEDEDENKNYFTMAQRIRFKRAKFDIKIISEKNEQNARYELFKRINLGGTGLSEQEVTKFLLIMINKKFVEFLESLAEYSPFQKCITEFPETMYEEQYDLELVSIFLVFKNSAVEDMQKFPTISDFITNKMMEFAKSDDFDWEKEKDTFEKTFKLLIGTLKNDSFRRFDKDTDSFTGEFSKDAYETIVTGIGANIDKWKPEHGDKRDKLKRDKLTTKIKSLWENSTFTTCLNLKKKIEKIEKKQTLYLIQLAKKWFV